MQQDNFLEFELDKDDDETRQEISQVLQAAGAATPVTPQSGNSIRVPMQLSAKDQQLLRAVTQLKQNRNVGSVSIHTADAGTFIQGGWSGETGSSKSGYAAGQQNTQAGYSTSSKFDDEVPQSGSSWREYETPGKPSTSGDMPKQQGRGGQHKI